MYLPTASMSMPGSRNVENGYTQGDLLFIGRLGEELHVSKPTIFLPRGLPMMLDGDDTGREQGMNG